MTTLAIVSLVVAVWGQRLLGGFVIGPVLARRPAAAQVMGLVPAAVVMAVVIQLSVADGRSLVVDERLAGMVVAAVLVWRRAPFLAVVVAAALTTAGLRSL